MPVLIPYLVKLFLSLGIVFLFYQLVLRKLTFYNANRWYLLVFTFLSFLVPFVNVSPVVQDNQAAGNLIQYIPSVQTYSIGLEEATHCPAPLWSATWNKWDWILLLFTIGALFLFLRFIVRCLSFLKLRSRASLIAEGGLNIYHVDEPIIPFSFGNSIFINSSQHSELELREIIRHEFIHVKQRHTLDILWAELVCMLNWYNPAAWLLRSSIRQNLEFIADHKVLENGVDKKQYQYLLLKVIGNDQFSIAQKFNFSSLKKRIAMMNKTKTARVHLLRFLLVLPVLGVILVSFRNQIGDPPSAQPVIVKDTIPDITRPNDKGYIINIKDNKGQCMVVVMDRDGKVVEKLPLTQWNDNPRVYVDRYGEIPPPPKLIRPRTTALPDQPSQPPVPPVPPVPPGPPVRSDDAMITRSGQFEISAAAPVAIIAHNGSEAMIAPTGVGPAIQVEAAVAVDDRSPVITGKEDILVTITKYTTRQQLEEFQQLMKTKDVDLAFEKIEYNEKGVLVALSGTMKSGDSRSNFVVNKFEKLVLSMIRKDGRTWFKVHSSNTRELVRYRHITEPARAIEARPLLPAQPGLSTLGRPGKKVDDC